MTDVELRPLTEQDLPWLWQQSDDPVAEWKRWDAPYLHVAEQREPLEAFVERWAGTLDSPHRRLIAVGHRPAGLVTRWEEPPAGGGWWELGIVIHDPGLWGRGVGTTALRQWTELTFVETDAEVLTLTTWSGNERMVRTGRRAGFSECGRVPRARLWAGRRWDSIRLARLRAGDDAGRLPD